MNSTSLQKTLERLLVLVGDELIDRIEAGTASSQDLNVARQLLRDNGIDLLEFAKANHPVLRLSEHLPFEDPAVVPPAPPEEATG